jgi:integrase
MARILKLHNQTFELPKGVEVVKGVIRIGFTYRGRYWYETLGPNITVDAINRAGIKRAAIKLEIQEGTFNYQRHFPSSKNALKASGISQANPNLTIAQALSEESDYAKEKKAPSTLKAELPKHKYILQFFGASSQVRHVTTEDVERFKRWLRQKVMAKTANNVLIPLRSILRRAHARGIIRVSVHDRFQGFQGPDIRPKKAVQPLTLVELDQLASVPYRPVDRDMFIFNSWTGLSVSELMALAWEDVDMSKDVWLLNINRARVNNQWKCPKEVSRARIIELNSKAQALLAVQRSRTQLYPAIDVDVLQRDNITTKKETIRPVFRNSKSGHSWNPVSLDRCFRYLLRKADIAPRGANQTRHTFASRMLTAGLPMAILAQLMGHSGESMIRRHYGIWIVDDSNGKVARMMDTLIDTLDKDASTGKV